MLEPLDEDAVRRAAAELKAAGVVSIAVCYLFSYMNPAHEQRTGALIRESFPEAHISLSCEVLSRVREWPRLSATLLNAYLAPVLVTYIADLEKRLDAAGVDHAAALPDAVERRRDAVRRRGHRPQDRAQPAVGPGGGRAGERLSAARRRRGAASSRSTWAAPVATSPSSKAARRSK